MITDRQRLLVLGMGCLVVFALQFAATAPYVLEVQIKDMFSLNDMQFQYITIGQYAACIPFAVFSGMLIDRVGNKKSNLFFATLQILGLVVSMLAMHDSLLNFNLFITGRVIFGMGMAGTLIWYSSINSVFFFYTNNAMSMAILVCFSAFGATLTGLVLPVFYTETYSVSQTLMVPIYV